MSIVMLLQPDAVTETARTLITATAAQQSNTSVIIYKTFAIRITLLVHLRAR